VNIIDYVQHSKMQIDIHIPFSGLSENQNNDTYTDPSLVHFSSCDVDEAVSVE